MLFDPKWELEPWQRLLLDAAEVIEQEGWEQLQSVGPHGEVCALEAMYRANGRNITDGVFMLAHARLVEVIGTDSIPTWNDEKGQTKAEVLAALRQAAKVTAEV